MVTFKEFLESFSSGCSHTEILALIKQFKDNIKNASISYDDKYLPLRMVVNCFEEHKVDDKDLEKLSYWINYKANTPYLTNIKNTAILAMLDKYEIASAHHGVPSFKVPYDPAKSTFLVILIQKLDPRSVIEPEISGDFQDIYRQYGDNVDICLKIPFAGNVVQAALDKRQSILNYIRETGNDNYAELLVEDSNEVVIETYFHNKDRKIDSILLPNDTLRRGLDVDSYSYNIFANLNDYVYYALRDNKYHVLYSRGYEVFVINDTGEQNVR